MHIKKLKIGVLLLAATSAFSLVPQTTAAADPYNNIVRSFNSLNECEFYRQYKNHGKKSWKKIMEKEPACRIATPRLGL